MTEEPHNSKAKVQDVYDEIRDLRNDMNTRFATKTELRLTVLIGVLGGSGLSAVITGHRNPVTQAAWYYGRVKGWV